MRRGETQVETRPRRQRRADGRRSLQRRPRCVLGNERRKATAANDAPTSVWHSWYLDQKQPIDVWHAGTSQGEGCDLHAPTHKRPAKTQ
ncbi:hypothetical protein ACQJBY_013091 [Aegilops geniculata]